MAELKVKLLAYTPNAEEIVASAGKLCYSKVGVDEIQKKQTPEDTDRFVKMLSGMGHLSPLEHCSFTFAVEGVSRALTHQLVRHRIASYSQQSQRYVDLSDNFEYIVPKEIKRFEYINNRYDRLMATIFEEYVAITQELLFEYCKIFLEEREVKLKDDTSVLWYVETAYTKSYQMMFKKAIENARYVLPNACETKIVFTMNARTLLNFLEKRECNRSQDEIRGLAEEVRRLLIEACPSIFKYSGAGCRVGKCPEGKMCCNNPKPRIK